MTYPLPTNIFATDHSGLTEDDHEKHHDAVHGKVNDWIDAKQDYGVDPAASSANNYTGLQNAFNDAETDGVAVQLPPGSIPVDNTTSALVWNGGYPMIQGHGQRTELLFDSNSNDGLVLGDGGVSSGDKGMAGFVRQLRVRGPGSETAPSPSNYKAGIVIDGIHGTDMANLYVRNFDIGYDLRGNSYMTTMTKCHARYRHTNVGFLMQYGPVGGNDFTLIDCWFGGVIAAINVEGSAGGLTVIGGQLACGRLSGGGSYGNDDDSAAFRMGKNYDATGSTGSTGRLNLVGTSFEGCDYSWYIRNYADGILNLWGCSFHDNNDINGMVKSSAGDLRLRLVNHELASHVTFPSTLVSITGGTLHAYESGTTGDPSLDGIGTVDFEDVGGIVAYAGYDSAGFYGGDRIALGGLYLRNNAGTLESSTSPNSGWSAV